MADAAAAAAPSSVDAYDVLSVIGKGSFGTVSKIRRKADGRVLVWKELNYGSMREKEKQLVVSEVNILRELRHPFIVRYYDRIIARESTKIYIVMEYCEGGDLGNLIKKCKKEGSSVDEEFVWHVFTQITMALKECHKHREAGSAGGAAGGAGAAAQKVTPILHRDLKPGNIFLDGARNIKIGDFGLAKELTSESKFAYTNVGTPFYMSPEMINEMKYNAASDIWALGCLLYELCALAPPFDATNQLSLAVKINAGKFARIPAKYSDDLFRAIRAMLTLDSVKRPTVDDLEQVPRIASLARESGLVVKEYGLNHAYAARARDLRAREDDLARREAALAAGERALREREAALAARQGEVARAEAALAARAGTAADEEGRRYSTGDRPRRPSASGATVLQLLPTAAAAAAPAPGGGIGMGGEAAALRRVRSMSSNQFPFPPPPQAAAASSSSRCSSVEGAVAINMDMTPTAAGATGGGGYYGHSAVVPPPSLSAAAPRPSLTVGIGFQGAAGAATPYASLPTPSFTSALVAGPAPVQQAAASSSGGGGMAMDCEAAAAAPPALGGGRPSSGLLLLAPTAYSSNAAAPFAATAGNGKACGSTGGAAAGTGIDAWRQQQPRSAAGV